MSSLTLNNARVHFLFFSKVRSQSKSTLCYIVKTAVSVAKILEVNQRKFYQRI